MILFVLPCFKSAVIVPPPSNLLVSQTRFAPFETETARPRCQRLTGRIDCKKGLREERKKKLILFTYT